MRDFLYLVLLEIKIVLEICKRKNALFPAAGLY